MDNPKNKIRKKNRLKNFDYSTDDYYFITICSLKKQKIFSDVINSGETATVVLTEFGKIIDHVINLYNKTPVNIINYVIMPNHVHLLIELRNKSHNRVFDSEDKTDYNVNIKTLIRCIKTLASTMAKTRLWQDSFYDHIIRNNDDYINHNHYITSNPKEWLNDEYW